MIALASASASVAKADGAVLSVRGLVTADNVVALRREGERLLQSLESPVEVSLTKLESAHSIVLSLLLSWQRLAQSQRQAIVFTGISERLRSLSALSGLHQHLSGF